MAADYKCAMRKILMALGSPRWLAFLLPWFMLLLIVGTIAQRYIGLIDAQNLFFSSWIVWIGPVPMLGGITTLMLITLSLLVKLLWFSPWVKEKAGTILAHIAILMLMLGGGITYLVNQEGYVTLLEGETAQTMQDYYLRELQITQQGKPVAIWQEAALKEGAILTHPSLPFTLKVEEFCSNCATFVQENPTQKRGIAKKLLLQDAPATKEKEGNKAGVAFTVDGLGYIAYELLPSQAPVIKGYKIEMARKSLPLPFSITLLDFEKIRYPSSDQAKEYQSLVEIRSPEEGVELQPSKARRTAGGSKTVGACPHNMKCWQQTIAMNEPLRYRGYAIYQSSFLRMGDQEASVLAVVKNDGWWLPYLSTFLLALGLIWQCLLHQKKREETR
jgi:hypothetical protein